MSDESCDLDTEWDGISQTIFETNSSGCASPHKVVSVLLSCFYGYKN